MAEGTSGRRATVVVAVSGGIAAYKACEVVRRLRDHEIDVRVALTDAAARFVGPTTFAALSAHRVVASLFEDSRPEEIAHVRWAEACDLLCVAPATADFLGKMAHGLADDFPSTLHLAVTGPVMVAPAMEDDMFRHPAVQENLRALRQRGVGIVGPDRGALASGRQGPGRMASPAAIVDTALRMLEAGGVVPWLAGHRVLVTSGPTREPLDPIRVFTNRSSGRMGHALAAEAALLGAQVELVSGPTGLEAPAGVSTHQVETAAEMADAVRDLAPDCDIAVLAAAVCDFAPAERRRRKIKKGGSEDLQVGMARTEDILGSLRERHPELLLLGFAAETEELEARARAKLESKGCDLIVANRVGEGGTMGSEDGEIVILDRRGGRERVGRRPKSVLAARVWEAVRSFEASGPGEGSGSK